MKRKRNQKYIEQNLPTNSQDELVFQIEPFHIKETKNSRTEDPPVDKGRLKSIIVVDHKEKADLVTNG